MQKTGQLQQVLKKKLVDAKRIAVVAIGSELRGDDAAGMLSGRELHKKISVHKKAGSKIKVFFGETAPENLTGEIRKYEPSHIILIDAVDAKKDIGKILVFTPQDTVDGTSFSTHNMPLQVFSYFLMESMKCEVIILGIQVKNIGFGKPVSKLVKKSCLELAKILFSVIISK